VRSRVCEDLVREEVRANLLAGVTPSEATIVDAATARGVEMVRSHAAPRFAPRARVREAIKACPTPRRRSDIARAWIGRQYSLSDTAIRKRAKANGWTRDLSGAVRSRVRKFGSRGVRANELAGPRPG
jgi:hypothetical protein